MARKRSKSGSSQELERLALLKIVKSSTLLSQREKDVWGALYQLGTATGQEIDRRIGAVGCASSRLIELERRGMATRMGRRHCSVSGKSAALWGITMAPPMVVAARVRKVALSPTNSDLKSFVTHIRLALLGANSRGMRVPAEIKRVLKWLEEGAPCAHDKAEKRNSTRNKKTSRT